MPFTKTFHGFIENTHDTLLIIEACRNKMLPTINRRLIERERATIKSGTIIVFDESESGIKRWTDGFLWSPSRILGNFLVYRELASRENRKIEDDSSALIKSDLYSTDNLGYGNGVDESTLMLTNQRERALVGSLTTANTSYNFKIDGLIKKTIRMLVDGNFLHIVNYYNKQDVLNDLLPTPSTSPEFNCVTISPDLLSHLQGYSNNNNALTLSHHSLNRPRKRCNSMDKHHQKVYRQRLNSCGSQDLSRPHYHMNYRHDNNHHSSLMMTPHQASMGYVVYNNNHSLPSILDSPTNSNDSNSNTAMNNGNNITELPYYHPSRVNSNPYTELPPPISNNTPYRSHANDFSPASKSASYSSSRQPKAITYTNHYHSQQHHSGNLSPTPSPTPSPPTSLPSVIHCNDGSILSNRVNSNYYDANPVVINRSTMESNNSSYNAFMSSRRSPLDYY